MIDEYYIPKRNISLNYKNWNFVQGVPCKLISKNKNGIKLLSFHDQMSTIKPEQLNTDFVEAEIIDKVIKNCDYEGGLNIEEFNILKEISNFNKEILEKINKCENKHIKSVFKEKSNTITHSNGCTDAAILKVVKDFKKDEPTLISYKPFFNRTKRWMKYMHNGKCIDHIQLDDYINDINYPSPLGIRKKDFALPSEYLKTIKELYLQLLNFKDFPSETKQSFSNIIPLDKKDRPTHTCMYCNRQLSILNVKTKQYKSKDNCIELCHDNPNLSFIKSNVYWGCGKCNREQGGFTKEERIIKGFKLLNYTCKNKDEFLEKVSIIYDNHLQVV